MLNYSNAYNLLCIHVALLRLRLLAKTVSRFNLIAVIIQKFSGGGGGGGGGMPQDLLEGE